MLLSLHQRVVATPHHVKFRSHLISLSRSRHFESLLLFVCSCLLGISLLISLYGTTATTKTTKKDAKPDQSEDKKKSSAEQSNAKYGNVTNPSSSIPDVHVPLASSPNTNQIFFLSFHLHLFSLIIGSRCSC